MIGNDGDKGSSYEQRCDPHEAVLPEDAALDAHTAQANRLPLHFGPDAKFARLQPQQASGRPVCSFVNKDAGQQQQKEDQGGEADIAGHKKDNPLHPLAHLVAEPHQCQKGQTK
ncbi:MAG: hypothetical protein DCC55_21205 [Chloroflexi bacterium]|nr:MAG: hypothetical protein DCC55_21205 [Chloroflexota bacterium]